MWETSILEHTNVDTSIWEHNHVETSILGDIHEADLNLRAFSRGRPQSESTLM